MPIKQFSELTKSYDVFLFDAYGVFKGTCDFVKGALERMETLVNQGKKVIVLSNASSIAKEAKKSYEKKGLLEGKHYHEFVTSGEVTNYLLRCGKIYPRYNNPKVYTLGMENHLIFKDTGYELTKDIDEADFAFLGIPQIYEDDIENYKKESKKEVSDLLFQGKLGDTCSTIVDFYKYQLQRIFEKDLPLLNANPDYAVVAKFDGKEELIVRQGLITKLYQDMGGEVQEIGKPHPYIYKYITDEVFVKLGINKIKHPKITMVGDTLRTDIIGAITATEFFKIMEQDIIIDSILVLSGVTSREAIGEVTDVEKFAKDAEYQAMVKNNILAQIKKEQIVPKHIALSIGV